MPETLRTEGLAVTLVMGRSGRPGLVADNGGLVGGLVAAVAAAVLVTLGVAARTAWLVPMALAVVAGAALNRQQHPNEPFEQMNVYQEVMEYIRRDYVTKPNLNEVTDGALHGLLASLDADSSYLSPAEYQAFLQDEKTPHAGSVGLVVTKRMGYAAIVDVTPGSPAARANLMRGDFLESVDHHSTTDLSLVAIRSLLTGRPGTSVQATAVVVHHVQPRELTLQRVKLAKAPLGIHLYPGHIGYIAVPDLRKGRAEQVRKALGMLKHRGARRFILDLRNCGSGSYRQGEELANLFLRDGTITTLQGQTVAKQVIAAQAGKFVTAAPMAVPKSRPMRVTPGSMVLRSPCLNTTWRSRNPLARAVRM